MERRADYIHPLREQLGVQHPLLQLVCQCLHNTPAQRPSAEELLQQLEIVRPQVDRAYGRQQVKVEMAKLQVAMMGVFRMRETEVGEKDGEIEQLRHDLQQVQVRACTCCFLYYSKIELCNILVTGGSGSQGYPTSGKGYPTSA